uniref:Uncharacterized protein n=1 Tax=Periophthalmus magnuspinnatus TaxID=409849 RepID=A0A3B3ZM48_9GOBI
MVEWGPCGKHGAVALVRLTSLRLVVRAMELPALYRVRNGAPRHVSVCSRVRGAKSQPQRRAESGGAVVCICSGPVRNRA